MEEATNPPTEIWPDNLQASNVFIAMMTQWRSGPGGVIGLDYSVLPMVMRLMAIPRKEWPDIFESIRVLEDAALETIASKKGKPNV